MNIEELKTHYLKIYSDFNKRGFRYKMSIMGTLVPAFIFNIYKFYGRNHYIDFHNQHTITFIILIVIGTIVFFGVNLLVLDSMTFISQRKVVTIKNNFKHDLRSIIETEIPEIIDYIYYQKIHPNTFFSSGFFKSRNDEYLGDDWMKGMYKDVSFELCELCVYKVYKKTFNGIFVHLTFDEDKVNRKLSINDFDEETQEIITQFMNTYNAEISISNVDYKMYMLVRIKGIFFENKNENSILKLDKDLNMLKDLVKITKQVIDYR